MTYDIFLHSFRTFICLGNVRCHDNLKELITPETKLKMLFAGAGVATVTISFWLCTYYNVIISWAMSYMVAGFSDPLPWVGCQNWWNTEKCWDVSQNTTAPNGSVSSTQEFYE